MTSKQLHVTMISSPGIGHILPVLLLAHRLATRHNLRVTVLPVITTDGSPAVSQLLTSFTTTTKNLSIIQIPAADISAILPPEAKVVTHLCVMMRETIPAIRTAISTINPRPDVLIGDIFSTESWVVAEELSIPKYVFVTSNAWFTALFAYSPVLDKQVSGQYVDQKMLLDIPGCKPVSPDDVIDPMLDREDETYKVYLNQAIGVTLSDGVLINTWEDLEPRSLDALRNNEILQSVLKNKPVYTVGPIHKRYEPDVLKNDIIEWLDKQPEQSVVYVSFGSGGTISVEQTEELAWGLELSRQRFIWVVRPPTGKHSDGSFLRASESSHGLYAYLPEGFLARTVEVGFVVPSWGPQVEILNHISVGGFFTHCGWNSTLESVTSGIPMISWPLYAEQKMNATMLADELKVAVKPKVWPTRKVVGRDEVARMVTGLVAGEVGKEMKVKVKRLKEDAQKALCENGSSYISICKFVEDCWSRI
ncbi:hypothetical protein SSX86_009976 [Deinandra increscens subsp. villosa]|uniref:Glycosyltransferase n=1 Tax=Deinandra increscens subsp. villosa TaxID=3103831 RepID=A0AAP0DER5_9ASTR